MITFAEFNCNTPVSVTHQGKIIAMAIAKHDDPRNKDYGNDKDNLEHNIYQHDICYRVLSLNPDIPEDDENWTPVRKLHFPDELRVIGLNLIQVDSAQVSAELNIPLQLVSDGKYVNVLQQSSVGTLLLTRFLMIDELHQETNESVSTLQSPWEVRYQRSQKVNVPAGLKDSLGYKNMNEDPFLEPTFELSFITNLSVGRFSALILPTTTPNLDRWQFFAHNDSTGEMDAYSIPRTENGLFILDEDEAAALKMEKSSFTLADADGQPLDITSAPNCLLYQQQELEKDAEGNEQLLKRGSRMMMAVGAGSETPPSDDGNHILNHSLELDGYNDTVRAGFMETYERSDGYSFQTFENYKLTANTSLTLSIWIKPIDLFKNAESHIIDILDANGQRIYLRIRKTQIQWGIFEKAGEGNKEVVFSLDDHGLTEWIHLSGVYQKDSSGKLKKLTLFINGEEVAVKDMSPYNIQTLIDGHLILGARQLDINTPNQLDRYFNGYVSDFGFWNRELSVAEIQEIYFNGLAHFSMVSNPDIDPAFAWLLNEGTGEKTIDVSGAFDGFLFGVPKWSNQIPANQPSKTLSPTAIVDFGLNRDGTLAIPSTSTINLQKINAVNGDVTLDDGPQYVFEDENGLTIIANHLEFAQSFDRPKLVNSADGLLHLYFSGEDGTYSSAEFQTQIQRAIFSLSLGSNYTTSNPSWLEFRSKKQISAANEATLEVSPYDSNPETCQLRFEMAGDAETWTRLPRLQDQLKNVINGIATDQFEDDGQIREGKKAFYAYRENRALVQLPVGNGSLWFINRHSEGQTPPISTGQLSISASLSTSDSDNSCQLELVRTLIEDGNENTYKEVWRNLPTNVESLIQILHGQVSTNQYDYTGLATIYSLDGRGEIKLPEKSEELRAGSQLFTVINQGATEIEAGTGILNPRSWMSFTAEGNSDYTIGSHLFGVRPKDIPEDGSILSVPDQLVNTPETEGQIGTWAAPTPNYSLRFDGQTHLEMTPEKVKDVQQDFTLETWIKPENPTDDTNYSLLQMKQTGDDPILMGLFSESDGKHYPIVAKDTFGVKSRTSPLIINEWNHLAASYKFGYALNFDGSHYIDCGNDSQYNPYERLTLEAWVHWDGSNGEMIILSKKGEDSGFELLLDDGKPTFRVHIDYKDLYSGTKHTGSLQEIKGDHTLDSLDTTNKEVWYYIAARVRIKGDASSSNLFLELDVQNLTDRAEPVYRKDYIPSLSSLGYYDMDSSYAKDLKLNNSDTNLIIGGKQGEVDDASGSFKGMIDEARLWTRTLSDSESTENADNFGITEDLDGLIARWELKVGEGDVAYDSIGINHGQISDPDLWISSDISVVWKLYLNGEELEDVIPLEGNETLNSANDQLTIGASKSSGVYQNQYFGDIDETRIWNHIRTKEQINDNRYRPLIGSESGLAGYWALNDEATPEKARDSTESQNNGTLVSIDANFDPGTAWVQADSPIGTDAPEILNVLAISSSGMERTILSGPHSEEYGDLQYDSAGNLIGVMKRCYFFMDADNGKLNLLSGFKVGDLDLKFIRQIQTAPTLTGFIEGAPPVPSENLTVESSGYENTASIELEEARETVHMYSTSRENGNHQSSEYYGGGMVSVRLNANFGALGVGFSTQAAYLQGKYGEHGMVQSSNGSTDSASFQDGTSRSIRNRLNLTGNWESPNELGEFLNDEIGKRYLPNNMGYALVKSRTADLYALRLKSKGTLVAYQLAINPDIPEDWNIIMFPLNDNYVKNGTLDGKVGFVNDPAFPEAGGQPASYFKPIEAYALKTQIQNQEQGLKAYYDRFSTKASREENSPAALAEWQNKAAKRNLVNTYVWTAGGGLYAEEEQFMHMKKESIGGTFESQNEKGMKGSIEGTVVGLGGFFEHDALSGSYLNVTSMKTKEESQSFGLKVNLDGEGFLNKFNEITQEYETDLSPGKVDAYRFMTFYLSPKKGHFDSFFEEVVDDTWLQNSDDANARALRSAKSAENGVWRVMHRVTYVSRVPQTQQTTSAVAGVANQTQPAVHDEVANQMLLDLVSDKLDVLGVAAPNLTEVAETVDYILSADTVDRSSVLSDQLSWWESYWTSLVDEDQRSIRQDLISYLKGVYEID